MPNFTGYHISAEGNTINIRKKVIAFGYITHSFFALYMAFLTNVPYIYYPLVLIGSLLPDIDHAQSKINQYIPLFWAFDGHRRVTHSFLGFAVITCVSSVSAWLLGISYVAGLYLGFGYLSHIVSDMLTPHGCPVFYPHERKYSLVGIKTGSVEEYAITGMLMYLFLTGILGVTI